MIYIDKDIIIIIIIIIIVIIVIIIIVNLVFTSPWFSRSFDYYYFNYR